MWPFHKTGSIEPKPVQPPPKKCDHKWTDIRIDGQDCWYIDFNIDNACLSYTIYEPYVCIHCKKRKDVELDGPRVIWTGSNKSAWKELESICAKYPQIKPRPIVEDAISDMQLVDRDYLRVAAQVMGLSL